MPLPHCSTSPSAWKTRTDHTVPQLRDASRQVLHGQTEGKKPRILDFHSVIEDGETNRRALLCVVGVYNGVGDRFPNCDRRHAPALLAAKTPNLHPVESMFLHERNGLVDGADKVGPDLGAIEDASPVNTRESPDLDPRIGEVLVPLFAEEQHTANGGNASPLMVRHEAQRLQVRPPKRSNRGKQL
jgi:hypothetical protein